VFSPLTVSSDSPAVRILGIGSPFGDDKLGWDVITKLRRCLQESGLIQRLPAYQLSLTTCDRPGSSLLELMQGAELVVLIDAVSSGGPVGTLLRLQGEQIEAAEGLLSSHGFGVASALALAKALNALPARVVLWGMEVGPIPETAADAPMRPEVEQAMPRLVAAVIGEVEEYLAAGGFSEI
jgi:hydrogenase maturation protease